MSITGRIKESLAVVTDPFVDISDAVAGCTIHLRSIALALDGARREITKLLRLSEEKNDRIEAMHATIGQLRQPLVQIMDGVHSQRNKESLELLSGIKNAITNIAGALDAERSKARKKTDGGVAEIARIAVESRRMDVARHDNEKVRIDLRHAELLKAITDASNAHSHCSNNNRIKDDRTHSELMQILGRICDKIEGGK